MAVVVLAHKVLPQNQGIIAKSEQDHVEIFPLLFVNFSTNVNPKHWAAVINANYKLQAKSSYGSEFDPIVEKHLIPDSIYMLIPFTEWAETCIKDVEWVILLLQLALEIE